MWGSTNEYAQRSPSTSRSPTPASPSAAWAASACRPSALDPGSSPKAVADTPVSRARRPRSRLIASSRGPSSGLQPAAQLALEHLARGVARQRIDEVDGTRHLEVREPRAAVLLQFLGGGPRPGAAHDAGGGA